MNESLTNVTNDEQELAIFKIFFLTSGGIFTGIVLFYISPGTLRVFAELQNSDFGSVLGTIYGLITAFILVNAWNHFSKTNSTIADENEAVVALWNSVDYLDDARMSKAMNQSLEAYLDSVIGTELPDTKVGKEVNFPSPEFSQIIRAVDSIEFDDPRDPIAFESLVKAYNNLSTARSERITDLANSIPPVLKLLYTVVSIIFWLGYLLQGFEAAVVYFSVLGSITVFTVLSYVIITDLDKPLSGLLIVDTSIYRKTAIYIEESGHDSFSTKKSKYRSVEKTVGNDLIAKI